MKLKEQDAIDWRDELAERIGLATSFHRGASVYPVELLEFKADGPSGTILVVGSRGKRSATPTEINVSAFPPAVWLYLTVQRMDLIAISSELQKSVNRLTFQIPKKIETIATEQYSWYAPVNVRKLHKSVYADPLLFWGPGMEFWLPWTVISCAVAASNPDCWKRLTVDRIVADLLKLSPEYLAKVWLIYPDFFEALEIANPDYYSVLLQVAKEDLCL